MSDLIKTAVVYVMSEDMRLDNGPLQQRMEMDTFTYADRSYEVKHQMLRALEEEVSSCRTACSDCGHRKVLFANRSVFESDSMQLTASAWCSLNNCVYRTKMVIQDPSLLPPSNIYVQQPVKSFDVPTSEINPW